MSFWNQRTLTCYIPFSTPELTFFYIPLKGTQQAILRRQYSEFEFLYELMEYVFCDRLYLFRVSDNNPDTSYFAWPTDEAAQDALLENIPKSVVIEVGASLLGWKRIPGETPKDFVDRILEALKVNRK